jgi:plastocyanin
MKRLMLWACICFAAGAVAADAAKEHVVDQKDKQFTLRQLVAKVGDTVTFKNNDTVTHNIFSLSDAQSFDLGTYANGQSRSIKLEKEGLLEVECAVHPNMKMEIKVSK